MKRIETDSWGSWAAPNHRLLNAAAGTAAPRSDSGFRRLRCWVPGPDHQPGLPVLVRAARSRRARCSLMSRRRTGPDRLQLLVEHDFPRLRPALIFARDMTSSHSSKPNVALRQLRR
jgi:hypothetical protein